MEWKELYSLSQSAYESHTQEGCYITLYKRNKDGGIDGTMWMIMWGDYTKENSIFPAEED